MINEQHLNRLRRLVSDAPSSLYGTEDIGVWAGQARIQFQTEDEDCDAAGTVDRALYFKLLNDAAALAAGSLVDEHFVTCESFDMYVMRSVAEGELVALAQVVTARDSLFTVEAVLTDENGRKLARAHGVFTRSTVSLPSLEEVDEETTGERETAVGALWDSPVGLLNLN
jgi:acyl-coenzyme A thioesterase PaaI-like protein